MSGRILPSMVLLTILAGAWRTAQGAVPLMEDLSGCSLPNGVVTLPAAGQVRPAVGGAAGGGDLLKFSNGTMLPAPPGPDNAPLSPEALLAAMRSSKGADLRYIPDAGGANDGGALWAFSGCIADLGARYLAQAAIMNPSAPMEIPGTTRAPSGTHSAIAEGHAYIVQTTDAHFALVRVLEMTPEQIVLQYVYQPSGTNVFDVPEAPRVEFQRNRGRGAAGRGDIAGGGTGAGSNPIGRGPTGAGSPGAPLADTGAAGTASGSTAALLPAQPAATLPAVDVSATLGPRDILERGEGARIVLRNDQSAPGRGAPEGAVESLVRQREQMIQNRMMIAQAPARTPQEVERKSQAILDLGTLRAEEAADVLAAQVAFLNSRGAARELTSESMHPAYAALRKLGKAGSAAALRALAGLTDLDGPNDGMDSWYKARLLAQVIRGVEGDDVADFLLKREMEKATDPRRKALYEQLLVRH